MHKYSNNACSAVAALQQLRVYETVCNSVWYDVATKVSRPTAAPHVGDYVNAELVLRKRRNAETHADRLLRKH